MMMAKVNVDWIDECKTKAMTCYYFYTVNGSAVQFRLRFIHISLRERKLTLKGDVDACKRIHFLTKWMMMNFGRL